MLIKQRFILSYLIDLVELIIQNSAYKFKKLDMFQRQMISSFMLIVNLYTICKKNTGVNKKKFNDICKYKQKSMTTILYSHVLTPSKFKMLNKRPMARIDQGMIKSA